MTIIAIIIVQTSRLVPIGQARNAGLGRPYDIVRSEYVIRINTERRFIYDDIPFDGDNVVLPGIAAIFMDNTTTIRFKSL